MKTVRKCKEQEMHLSDHTNSSTVECNHMCYDSTVECNHMCYDND